MVGNTGSHVYGLHLILIVNYHSLSHVVLCLKLPFPSQLITFLKQLFKEIRIHVF